MLYHALLEYDTNDVVRSSSKMFWWRAAERPLRLPPDEPDDDADGIRWLKEVCKAQADSKAVEEVRMAEEGQAVKNDEDANGSDAVEQTTVTKEASKEEAKQDADSNILKVDYGGAEIGEGDNDDAKTSQDK